MIFININEKRPEYPFIDEKCIGRRCFHPVLEGSRFGCNNRMHSGCPDPLPAFDKEAAARQRERGWRIKR